MLISFLDVQSLTKVSFNCTTPLVKSSRDRDGESKSSMNFQSSKFVDDMHETSWASYLIIRAMKFLHVAYKVEDFTLSQAIEERRCRKRNEKAKDVKLQKYNAKMEAL
ncbi:hypothetical protein V6N13_104914 [Hibiscus sabdariffa]